MTETSKDLTIIVPTLNEEDNIGQLIESLSSVILTGRHSLPPVAAEILIIDDHSSDNTIQVASQYTAQTNPEVRIFVRDHDKGLSPSVIDGFHRAHGEIIIVMDADFSHPVEKIGNLYNECCAGKYDIVIASRYMPGGTIGTWPLKRRIISKGATSLARMLFPMVTDPLSGFFAVQRSVVDGVLLHAQGYKILLDVLGRGRWTHLKEIPYTFEDRAMGKSKLHITTMVQYCAQLLTLIRQRRPS